MKNSKKIEVSIACVTFNHEKYILKTIDSFVSQKTNFNYEIVVGDDSSTDNTKSILHELERKYNDRLRVIYNKTNLGAVANGLNVLKSCKGRYIALCDGDDQWTDSLKIQKQHDFLEINSEYVLTYSSLVGYENGAPCTGFIDNLNKSWTSSELIRGAPCHTQTVLFRNLIDKFPDEFIFSPTPDIYIWSMLGKYGSAYYNPEISPTVYNIHSGGMHSKLSFAEKNSNLILTHYLLFLHYDSERNFDVSAHFDQQIKLRSLLCYKELGDSFVYHLKLLAENFYKKISNNGALNYVPLSHLLPF